MAGEGMALATAFIRLQADLSDIQAQVMAAAEKAGAEIASGIQAGVERAASSVEPLNEQLSLLGEGAGKKIGADLAEGIQAGAEKAEAALEPLNEEIQQTGNSAMEAASKANAAAVKQIASIRETIAAQEELQKSYEKGSTEMAASTKAVADAQKKLQTAMGETAAESKSLTKSFEATAAAGEKVADVGKSLSLYVTLPVAAAGAASLKFATDFQSSMELLHTQAHATQAQVDSMSKAVLAMGPAVGTTANTLSTGLYHLVSQGLQGAKALDTLKVAAEGAKVGQANLEDVTNALGAVVVSGIKGSENYTQAMGVLNATVGAGDMHMQDLADAMGTGLPAKAAVFGVSLQQASAALAVFGDNNIRGAEAGTLLNSTIRLMGAPSAAAAKALDKIGLSSTALANDMRSGGILQAVQDLKAHMDKLGLSASQQAEVLTRAFGGKQAGGVLVLMDQIDRLKTKLQEVADGGNKFGSAWAATQKTFSFQLDQMKASAEKLGIEIGNVLMPYAARLASVLSDLVSKFDGLSKHTQDMILVLAGIAATIGPTLFVVGKLTQMVGALGEAIMFVAANPIVLLVAGIAAFAAAMAAAVLFPAKLQQGLQQVGLSASTSAKIVADLQAVFQQLSKAAQAVAPVIVQAWDTAKAAFVAAATLIKAVAASIEAIWSVWGKDITAVVTVAFDLVKTEVTTDLKVIEGIFKTFTDLLTGNWSKAWQDVENTLGAALQGIVNEVGTVLAAIPGKILGLKIPGASEIHSFGEAMKSWTIAGQTAASNFTDGFSNSVENSAKMTSAMTQAAAKTAASGGNTGQGTKMTSKQIYQLLLNAGFSPDQATNFVGIAGAESGGNYAALNNNPSTGDYSVGLFQENFFKALGPARTQRYAPQFGLSQNITPQAFVAWLQQHPAAQAAIAHDLFSSSGYAPWQGDAFVKANPGLLSGADGGNTGNPNFNLGGTTKKTSTLASSKTSLQDQFKALTNTVNQSGDQLNAAVKKQMAQVNAEIGDVSNKATLAKAKEDFKNLHTTVTDELSALKQDVKLNKTYDALKQATAELGTKVAPDVAAQMKKIQAELAKVSTPEQAAAVKKQMTDLEKTMTDQLADTKRKVTAENLFQGLQTDVAKLHSDVTPAIAAEMKKIQDEMSEPVTPAVLNKIKSQVSQVKSAVTTALDAAKAKIEQEKTAFSTAFSALASGLDSTFTKATNKALASMQVLVQTANNSFMFGGSITETPAQQTLDQLQAAHDAAAQQAQLASDQAQLAADQIATSGATAAQIASDQAAIADDQYNMQVSALQKQATLEQNAANTQLTAAQNAYQDQRDLLQQAMDQRLALLEQAMGSGSVTVQQGMDQMTAILSDPQYGIDANTAAVALGGQIYTGLQQSLAPVFAELQTLQTDMANLGVLPASGGAAVGTIRNPSVVGSLGPDVTDLKQAFLAGTQPIVDAVTTQTAVIKDQQTKPTTVVNAYTNPNVLAAIR